ncbi:MAG TPA: P-II family nitrogen regulator [Deltaproteobacteria bacterium]|nr:P-II family nitrogen regulator [Deltaproteobacteria bacterium]
MKEIKAYIRTSRAEEVIHALEDAGAAGFTVIEAKAVGASAVPERERFSVEYAETCSPITKIEVVCSDEETARLVEVIVKSASTGRRGDGMVFVSPVDEAVRIRTGERGEDALFTGRKEGA